MLPSGYHYETKQREDILDSKIISIRRQLSLAYSHNCNLRVSYNDKVVLHRQTFAVSPAEWQVARPPVADRKGGFSLQFSSLFPFNIILQKEACKWKRSRQRNTRLPFNKTLIIFERDKPSATGIPFARFVRLSLVEHLAVPSCCRYGHLVFLMSVCRADMRWRMRWEWRWGGLASLNYRHLFFH